MVRIILTEKLGRTLAVGGAKDNSINFYTQPESTPSTPLTNTFISQLTWSHTLKLDYYEFEGKKYENDGITEFSWNKTGSVFITTISDKMSSLLQFDGKKVEKNYELDQISLHTGKCFCLAVDPTDRYIATGGADFLISVIDTTEYAPIKTLTEEKGQIHQMNFSYDGNYQATVSEQKCIHIYNIKMGQCIQKIECGSSQYVIAWHPAKYVQVFTGDDKYIKGDKCDGMFKAIGL